MSADDHQTRSAPPPADDFATQSADSTPPAVPSVGSGTLDAEPSDTTSRDLSLATALPTVPGYDLLDELGRGGMGVVYKARQVNLNRLVALKMVLRAEAAGRVAVARFWAEAEVVAAVRHPNVVGVYEFGEVNGSPYMAMEYVPCGSLADHLTGGKKLPPRDAAALVEKIARGVAAAHDLGIVHRDLKPANVLLTETGEPKLTDFGLAKRQTSDATATGSVMGTPAYMAPEQAAGRAKFVGPPADVWALGVILYECLSGTRPFAADSTPELLNQITSAEPPALRGRVPDVPRDLDTIVSKCLTKEAGPVRHGRGTGRRPGPVHPRGADRGPPGGPGRAGGAVGEAEADGGGRVGPGATRAIAWRLCGGGRGVVAGGRRGGGRNGDGFEGRVDRPGGV